MVLIGQFVVVVVHLYPWRNMTIGFRGGEESLPSDMDLILQMLHQNKNETHALFPSSSASLSSTVDKVENGSSSSSPFTVFWNLYLPSGPNKGRRTYDALREQVHQVARSAAKEPLVLKYVTIGNQSLFMNHQIMTNWVNLACAKHSNLKCHHVKHVARGFEEVTLDELYDHCLAKGDNDYTAKVAYIHNKGSYNPQGTYDNERKKYIRQDSWRRHATAAALHPHCRHLSNSSSSSSSFVENNQTNNTCNVCGLFFVPLP